jgi:predicted PurR-regulated permease PerM
MENNIKKTSLLVILQYVLLGGIILHFGKEFFVPVCFAFFISFILYPVCKWLERKRISSAPAILISLSLLFIPLILVIIVFVTQLSALYRQFPLVMIKMSQLVEGVHTFLSDFINISEVQQKVWIKNFIAGGVNDIFSVLWTTSGSLVMFIIVPVYTGLILYYRCKLINFLIWVIPPDTGIKIKEVIAEVVISYYNFIKGMLVVYFIVGILNGLGLYFLSVPSPFFFGFIASILTIIPYIGIAVGSLLPITIAWITKDSVWYPVGVILIFSLVQILEANIIFPIAVGYRLKINSLSIILVVMLGGLIWGAAGMILFIPFLAIVKLIADKIPSWKPVSNLLE